MNLTGFGRFYWQRHIGHTVQFGGRAKPDYTVLMFSATRLTNAFLDLDENLARTTRAPGTSRTLPAPKSE